MSVTENGGITGAYPNPCVEVSRCDDAYKSSMGAKFSRSIFSQKRGYNVRSREDVNGQPGNYRCSPNRDVNVPGTPSETASKHKLIRNGKFELCRCDTISNASDVFDERVTDIFEHDRDSYTGTSENGRDLVPSASEHERDIASSTSERKQNTATGASESNKSSIKSITECVQSTVMCDTEYNQDTITDVSGQSRYAFTDRSELDRDTLSNTSELDQSTVKCVSGSTNETETGATSSSKTCVISDNVVKYRDRACRSQPYVCSRLSYMKIHGQKYSNVHPETIQWKKGNRLGRGAFGTVWLGLTATGELIAVKQVEMREDEETQKEYDNIVREVSLLRMVSHRNIVRYLGSSFENGVVSIFMQYAAGGSLDSILRKFGPLGESISASYTLQLLRAVDYLHGMHIVHRDIKSGNIMLTPDGVIKLIDFGCAKKIIMRLSRMGSMQMSFTGTPYWMAPEVIKESGHGRKSDIWSVGCTVYEMLTGEPPWGDKEPVAAIYAIGSDDVDIPCLSRNFSAAAKDFVQQCLVRDKVKRPNASNLLQHKFVTMPKQCLAETEKLTANFVEVSGESP